MPRTLRWYRGLLISGVPHSTSWLEVELDQAAGSTLVRTRWQIEFSTYHTVLFNNKPWGTTVYGVHLEDAALPGAPPEPITDPDHDWLWYEQIQYRRYYEPLGSPSYTLSEGPSNGDPRDSKAQRVFVHDNPLLQWSWQGSGSVTNVPVPYVTVTYEALVMLPP